MKLLALLAISCSAFVFDADEMKALQEKNLKYVNRDIHDVTVLDKLQPYSSEHAWIWKDDEKKLFLIYDGHILEITSIRHSVYCTCMFD